MENISKILLYLMACSIQSIKPEDKVLVGADLEKLLQTAKAHSVSAMVCMALEQTDTFRNAEESTRLKWIDAKNKAVRKNLLLDTERHQLEKEFAKNGIWYMPLKGSILKDWYPKFGIAEFSTSYLAPGFGCHIPYITSSVTLLSPFLFSISNFDSLFNIQNKIGIHGTGNSKDNPLNKVGWTFYL